MSNDSWYYEEDDNAKESVLGFCLLFIIGLAVICPILAIVLTALLP